MNCKNCGARLKDGAKVCPNCGALYDDNSGYVLLTCDDKMDDFYSDEVNIMPEQKKKGSGFKFFISLLLIIAIIGAGAYYYFTRIYDGKDNPSVSFTSGSGIINGDEKIIYVTLQDNADVEYIHGVTLYATDKTTKSLQNIQSVSTDYEYTKNVDSTFRAIFFDTNELDIKQGNDYTYTFEMNFSFVGSDKIYTYDEVVTFNGEIIEDVSDIIFDHSLDDVMTTETTLPADTTTTSTTKAVNNDYIYSGYWFTEPYHDSDSYTIYAIKFNNDSTYVTTQYVKNGNDDWQVTNYNNTFTIEDGYIVVNNGDDAELSYYKINADDSSLKEEQDGQVVQTLTNRKYNSIKNVEDFFGI
jgi:hypothetical protein